MILLLADRQEFALGGAVLGLLSGPAPGPQPWEHSPGGFVECLNVRASMNLV